MHYISFLSTIISFAFAASVFNRYRYKKGSHLLFWGLGLILYGVGTLTEVLLGFTFSGLALKLWYLSGAMLTAAFLGQGTVFLLIRRRRVALAMAGVLVAVALLALGLMLAAPLTAQAASYNPALPVSMQYKDILTRSGVTILLTILLNIYGTITLVGGALYSAYLFWRKKVLANRMLGNILIAAGALMPASAGTFIRAGMVDWLYVSEFIGVVLMYLGFTQATAKQPAEQPVTTAASAAD
jgi:hypothetical protein